MLSDLGLCVYLETPYAVAVLFRASQQPPVADRWTSGWRHPRGLGVTGTLPRAFGFPSGMKEVLFFSVGKI